MTLKESSVVLRWNIITVCAKGVSVVGVLNMYYLMDYVFDKKDKYFRI